MKLKDLFKIHVKTTKIEKRKVLLSLLLTFILTLLFIVIAFNHTIFNYIYKLCNNNYFNRTLIIEGVLTDEDKTIIKINNHVISMYSQPVYSFSISSDEYEEIVLVGAEKENLPEIIDGDNNLDNGRIICPINFVPKSDPNNNIKINKKEIINSKKLLGSKFTTIIENKTFDGISVKTIDTIQKQYTFGGTYNSENYMLDNNICFVSNEEINELYSFLYNDSSSSSTKIIIDNFKNLNDVKNDISELGYGVIEMTTLDYETIGTILTISIAIIFIFLLLINIIIRFNIKREISLKEKEMLLYRSLGFNRVDVLKMYLIDNYFVFIIATFLSCLISLFLGILVKNILSNSIMFNLLEIKFGMLEIITVIIVGLIYSLLIIFLKLKKFLKKDVIKI